MKQKPDIRAVAKLIAAVPTFTANFCYILNVGTPLRRGLSQ